MYTICDASQVFSPIQNRWLRGRDRQLGIYFTYTGTQTRANVRLLLQLWVLCNLLRTNKGLPAETKETSILKYFRVQMPLHHNILTHRGRNFLLKYEWILDPLLILNARAVVLTIWFRFWCCCNIYVTVGCRYKDIYFYTPFLIF
jgi:hypothetical protein